MLFFRQVGGQVERLDSADAGRSTVGEFLHALGDLAPPALTSSADVAVCMVRESHRLVRLDGPGQLAWEPDGPAAAATLFQGRHRMAIALLTGMDDEADARAFARLAELPHPYTPEAFEDLYRGGAPEGATTPEEPAPDFPPGPASPDRRRPLLVCRLSSDVSDDMRIQLLAEADALAAAFFEALAAR